MISRNKTTDYKFIFLFSSFKLYLNVLNREKKNQKKNCLKVVIYKQTNKKYSYKH